MQLVGLNSCHAGAPLPKGVKDAGATALLKALTKITQPYNGGVTFNFSNPTSNKFHREGETDPFFSLRDVTSGSKEITWNIADFDDATSSISARPRLPKGNCMRERNHSCSTPNRVALSLSRA